LELSERSQTSRRGIERAGINDNRASFSVNNEVKFIPGKKAKRESVLQQDGCGRSFDVEQERMDAMFADANLALGMKF
jgi:hypothetical protein